MMASPMRFQLVVAGLAIGGALLLSESQGPRPDGGVAFTLQDRSIDESSGLVDAGTTVLTVNDSGDGPVVYVVDRSTGETVGRTTYTDDEVVDVEALAAGPDDTLWVGDIGDNPWSRSSVAVYALPMPGPGDATVEAERYDFVYEGGPRDAEALLVHPVTGRLYVVSKATFGGEVFEAPRRLSADEPNVLRPVGEAPGLITDGAFFPDGRFAALRSYGNLTVLDAEDWRDVQAMRLPDQDQGEGLAMSADGRSVLLSTEGAGSDVLELPLTEDILASTAESARPDPSTPVESARADRSASVTAGEQVASDEDQEQLLSWAVAAGSLAVVLTVAAGVRALLRRRRSGTG